MNYKKLYSAGYNYSLYYKESDYKGVLDNSYNKTFEHQLACVRGSEINYILIVGENWCIDCNVNVPIIQAIAEKSSIGLKIITLDKFMSSSQKKVNIPYVVFLNRNYEYVDHWIECPQTMRKVRQNQTKDQLKHEMKNYKNGKYIEETIFEIVDILNKES